MRTRHGRRRDVAFVTACALAAATAAVAAAAPPHARQLGAARAWPGGPYAPLAGVGTGCHAFKLISVRGSGDTLNTIGKLGVKVSGGLALRARAANVDYGAHGLPYTAVGIDWWKLIPPTPAAVGYASYKLSENEGKVNLHKLIQQQVRDCPNQKLALLGFSQGAHAVADALSKGFSKLSQGERDAIRAVALVGNPRFNSKESFSTGTNLRAGHNGILGARTPGDLDRFKPRVRDWCRRDDVVCQGLPAVKSAHGEAVYFSDYGSAIVDFVAKQFGWRENTPVRYAVNVYYDGGWCNPGVRLWPNVQASFPDKTTDNAGSALERRLRPRAGASLTVNGLSYTLGQPSVHLWGPSSGGLPPIAPPRPIGALWQFPGVAVTKALGAAALGKTATLFYRNASGKSRTLSVRVTKAVCG